MPLSMYQASVPPLLQSLGSLTTILEKADAHCGARKIAPEVLVGTRLAPDMFPLSRQVQIATDIAKGVGRLAGVELPSYPDTETTFGELKERVAKTIAFIEGLTPAQIDGSEEKQISLKVGGNEMTFVGLQYLQKFVMPNVYFHVTTTYAILRANGVELGKRDYLGPL
jgi:hypothetical protein